MKERDNIVVNVNKNLTENENYKLVEYIKKNNTTRKKHFIVTIKKNFNLENFASL